MFMEEVMNLLVSTSSNIYPLDKKSIDKARARWEDLIHPPRSMGRLEDITCMMAGVYGKEVYNSLCWRPWCS